VKAWIQTQQAMRDQLAATTAELEQTRHALDQWRNNALRRAELVERFADQRNAATGRALTAETLLRQLHRLADLGEAPTEVGRINVHATARALSLAMTAAHRAAVPAQQTRPAAPERTAVPRGVAGDTVRLPAVDPVRQFRQAPVIDGRVRWDLSRPVPNGQMPVEVEYERALMRIEAVLEQLAARRPDFAGWAARIREAGRVPVMLNQQEQETQIS
jgi:hypothetical protein